MKTTNILLLGGLALVAYYFAQLGVASNTVNFLLNGVQFTGLTTLNVQIMVQNVSNAQVTLYALTGNISLNGNNIGTASTFNQVTIAPASQQVINLQVDLSLLSLPGTVLNLLRQTGTTYSFEISGNANINKLVVPFDVSQQITV